jgi:tetrahydromethanopterin S-methyltransferase subunit F
MYKNDPKAELGLFIAGMVCGLVFSIIITICILK